MKIFLLSLLLLWHHKCNLANLSSFNAKDLCFRWTKLIKKRLERLFRLSRWKGLIVWSRWNKFWMKTVHVYLCVFCLPSCGLTAKHWQPAEQQVPRKKTSPTDFADKHTFNHRWRTNQWNHLCDGCFECSPAESVFADVWAGDVWLENSNLWNKI